MTVLVEVKMGAPVQAASLGPNSVNVMVPVGSAPPERVAVSAMVPAGGDRRRGMGHDGRSGRA